MKQRWNHIFFLHGKIAPGLLQPYLPFELDLLDGMAILSIVPFKMDMIRLWNLPPAPFFLIYGKLISELMSELVENLGFIFSPLIQIASWDI